VRPNFRFRFPNPYSHREAEAGSPSKSVTATPSIGAILLNHSISVDGGQNPRINGDG
jgi:hypothetical protein